MLKKKSLEKQNRIWIQEKVFLVGYKYGFNKYGKDRMAEVCLYGNEWNSFSIHSFGNYLLVPTVYKAMS